MEYCSLVAAVPILSPGMRTYSNECTCRFVTILQKKTTMAALAAVLASLSLAAAVLADGGTAPAACFGCGA